MYKVRASDAESPVKQEAVPQRRHCSAWSANYSPLEEKTARTAETLCFHIVLGTSSVW